MLVKLNSDVQWPLGTFLFSTFSTVPYGEHLMMKWSASAPTFTGGVQAVAAGVWRRPQLIHHPFFYFTFFRPFLDVI
jgi:hypothetical protein